MKNRNNQVSIVIPNYNGIKFIEDCLKSLEKQTYQDFEIIVIDNASTDGSNLLIKQQFSYIQLIELDQNYGFCKAVNNGIKISDTKYVILLNNDTVVHECFVEELVKVMEKSDQIFSCSAKMLQLYEKELIDDAGDYYCALGWAFARGKNKAATKYNQDSEVFAACAGAAIYRRDIFERIGYFDETHFAYLEDIDIGYRARIYGYKNMYAAKAIVYHAGSGVSGSKHNEFKVRLASKNSVYLIYKNMPYLQIVLNLPFFIVGFLIKALFFTKKGLGTTYVSGLSKGIRMSSKSKKVKFEARNMGNYVKIQLELWLNLLKRFYY
jgi:GT2 family glycosyltransferase